MGNVPPELFRRKMAIRTYEQLESDATEFEAWAGRDNHLAALASYNDLAARFAFLTGRADLAQEFELARDELIAKALQPPPVTPGAPKGQPHQRKKQP